MAGWWRKKASQFWYVLRKNFLLQWRRPISTALELLCPLIAILVLILVRHTVPQLQVTRQCFITFDSDHLIVPYTGNYTIYYAPNTTEAQNISSIIQARLPGSTLIATDNEEMVVTRIQEGTDHRDRGCFINGTGIIFNNLDGNEISYTLRLRHDTPTKALGANKWYTHIRIPGLQPTGPRVYDNAYLNEGFLHLEHVVGLALIEWTTGSKPNLPPVAVRQLPYPGFDDDEFLANIDFILPFLLMAAFLVSAGFLTKELVLEKETQMREMMKMMGLNHWVLWITWYLKQFLFLLLPFIVLGVLLWGGQIFPKSNAAALVLFMIVFLLSLISFCFLISVWFDDSRLGLMAGFIFWFLTYFPHLFFAFYYDTLPLYVKIGSCLLSNTCMGLAVNVISLLELRGDGLQFTNYASPLSLDDQFSMMVITVMLLVDALIYLLIAWYINEIKPGQYGIPRKPYFIFQSTYWTGRPSTCCKKGAVCPSSKESTDNLDEEQEDIDGSDSSIHELLTPEPPPGIEVTNLLKKFKPRLYSRQTVEAVNIRKLKIYKGQITALLGHNGAGKTTTMSILTGLFPPTSGSVMINGRSVQEDIDRIRQDLGVCPQVNVLFDRMTINEHLWYFAKLKNIEGTEIPAVVEDMLVKMDLKKHQNKRVLELSGGNKRKLSVAIAMIGDPSVVILDEPTSGMDNTARELTWTLLKDKALNNKTTILVSTHSIDDTEMADRIVIMVHGKIRCSGRPPFLKEKYRVGYNLRVHLSDTAEPQVLEDTIKKHIKQYWLYSFVQHHEYTLPYDEMRNFPRLFAALEAKKWELGIISFSMQENSMEDVFINSKEGKLFPVKYEGNQRPISAHNPSILPTSPSWLSMPSSPSLLGSTQSSSELEELFQSAPTTPKKMNTIAEESGIDSSSSNHTALEEIDSPTPAQDVPLGFPAVDQSYNARQYYKKSSSSGLWLQRSQQNGTPVSPLTRQTSSSSYVGGQQPAVNRSRSSSNATTSNEERRLGVSFSKSTRALERSRPLIGRPSILNSIPGLEEESEEEEEEEMEGLWVQEAQQAQQAQEEVDFGREGYDMQRLISSSSTDSAHHKCNPLRDYTRLWLQQYRAMFLKRWYNFKRFLPALLWQLLLPLLFMVLGLLLSVVIHSPHRFDPSREMSMRSSAPSQTIKLFWSQYKQIDSLPFSFEDLHDPLYGISGVENYTQYVLDLRENVTSTVQDCCTYKYQLLDKFCATRTKSEIQEECSSIEEFGYHLCLDRCTSCCEAYRHQLPSCSNPRFQQLCSVACSPNVSQFCPAPPKLSLEDYENPKGPLDDMNTFIADYILRQADINTASYFQNFLGGFSIADEEPAYSVCGCEDGEEDEGTCQASLRQVELMNSGIEVEENPPVPPIPVFCDDNITSLTETLGINGSLTASSNTTLAQAPLETLGITNSSLFTSSNTTLAQAPMIPPGATASPNTLLSMLPSCHSVDDKTAFCLDVSCHSGGQCNTSNQSLASQYGTSSKNSSQTRPSITVWYNNQPYHVSPSILNMLHNLYLRGQENYSNHSIILFNHPLPRMPTGTLEAVEADLISFVVGAASILGASFLLASFSTFIVQEKSSNAKHLQMTSGLQLTAYWMANLTADMLLSILFVILSLIIFLIFQEFVPAYSGVALLAVLILLLLLCWSSAPLVYLISLPFQNIYTAYTIVLISFFMTTLICLALLYIVGILAGMKDEADIFYYVFIFHPGFGFAAGLSDLYISYVYQEACSQSKLASDICAATGLDYMATPFQLDRPGCGAIMIVLAIEGALFFLVTVILDHWNQISQLVQSKRVNNSRIIQNPSTTPVHIEFQFTRPDSGKIPRSVSTMSRAFLETIHDERAEVEEILTQDTIDPRYTVVVYDMEKDYNAGRCCNSLREPSNITPAVNGLTFKVEEGECFGLLGVNGAGKTTTFKILTGDISMTSGTAVIAGYDIRTQLRKVQQRIGYCPQFDALIERLTGRELLTMFARLRGIREKDIKREVNDKIDRLQLSLHADKECWKYSGGNKRKLSTAIALIGDTKVIFLDEPTSGMDIDTRRKFILTLQNVVKEEHRSIVLTSHSMTECEALCNKIGIMVDGQFKCIGSKEVLKDQYGENFTKLMIRVQPQVSPANLPTQQHPSVEEVDSSANHRPRSAIRLTNIQRTISRQGQRIFNFARGRQTRTARSREEVDGDEDTPVNRVQQAVLRTFRERVADQDPIDTQKDSITFQLPKNSVPLSEIFQVMEALHDDPSLSIVGYSVSQSTLNQVFNQIVKGRRQNRLNTTHQ